MSKKNQLLSDDAAFSPKPSFKEKLKTTWCEYRYISLAVLIPALLFFLIYMLRFSINSNKEIVYEGLYPFGNGTVLVLDLNGQYVYFFEYLRECVMEGGTLLYSWSRSLGGEFLGLYAYYLASPLSYLVCLFPKERIQEFLLVLFMLKAAICSGTMAFYLHKHSEKKNKLSIIAFAVMYAMSAYCVVQQSNTMWIDAVMWLPLVAYGVEQIIKHGKYKMFVIFLSLTVASNFYIGYMVCIFVFLYFFFYHFAHKDSGESDPRHEKNHFIRSFLRIGFFSLLAIGMAAVIVLSAYYSLQFGKNEFSNTNWDVALRLDFFDLLFKMLPSSYDTVRIDGLPFIYCGLLTAILAPLFFCCNKFTTREKIVSGIFLSIFLLSFLITVIDLVWHGFQKPQWLNNRYSFMFCFFLLTLAFKAFENLEHIGKQSIACVSAFIVGVVALLQCFAVPYQDKLISLKYGPKEGKFVVHEYATIILSIVCLVIYLVVISMLKRGLKREMITAVLLGVICVEVFLSGMCNVIDFGKDVTFSKYNRYSEFQALYRPVTETLQEYDTTFYRSEKTHHRKTNDNMALYIKGLSNCTSTLNKSTITFLHQMGYYSTSHKSQYEGGTPLTDSLLGIKYLISERDMSRIYGEPVLSAEDFAEHEGMTVEELAEATKTTKNLYNNLDSTQLNVYLNEYALSLAYAAGSEIYDINFRDYNNNFVSQKNDPEKYERLQNPDGYKSPFDRLNALVTAILGEDETVEVFKPVFLNGEPKMSSGVKKTISTEHIKYSGAKGSTITFTYTVPENVDLYLYFPSYFTRNIIISSDTMPIFDELIRDNKTLNGEEELEPCNERIVGLGYTEGTEYSLKVKINDETQGGQFYIMNDVTSYIYYLDVEVFEDAMERIQREQFIMDAEYEDDDLRGTIETLSDNRTILTTIPYDEGWKVYVDGERVEIKQALNALISFEIEDAGEHTLRFVYDPITFRAGLVITILSCAAFVAIIIFEKHLIRIKFIKKIFVIEEIKKEPLHEAKKRK